MGKLANGFLQSHLESSIEINRTLSENNACYVLITCGEPTQDGQMKVEFNYKGDPLLAAYLVESAQNIIDKEIAP